MARLTAQQVANYFLSLVEEECGDFLSNLKLQKLLYYAQGFHLAIEGEPLFEDEIEAWRHGPVVPDVYREYKEHSSGPIPRTMGMEFSVYDEETKNLLDIVYNDYGQYSAWKLARMTHDEPPWKDTPRSMEITHSVLKRHFETQIEDDE